MTKSVQYALIELTWKCSHMVVIPSKQDGDIVVYLLALFRYHIALHINLGIVMMTKLKNPRLLIFQKVAKNLKKIGKTQFSPI